VKLRLRQRHQQEVRGQTIIQIGTFPATPKFGTIKEGIKKITAKYSCLPNVNLTKFYSVNVTGAGTSPTTTSHHHHNK